MDRSRHCARVLSVLLTVVPAVACSSAPEQPILDQFFRASRLGDRTSLENFCTVTFDPRTDGTVTGFSITSVTPEDRKPLAVRELTRALDDAKAEDTKFLQKKGAYYSANREAVDRALRAENEKATLKGKDADVQAAWTKIREEGNTVSRKLADARTKLAAEGAVAQLSLADQVSSGDLRKYDGDLVTKDVTVSAPVKSPSGQTSPKTLVVRMQRAILKTDKEVTGKWVISGVKDANAPAGSKVS